ncbi:MAG: hypothetical protein QHJ73_05710 [Armatimonadota bacterium]|nr:hypothetical protein [Armatimonadota bacterium]
MGEVFIGTSAYASADTGLMRQAGIGWVRQGVRFPFVDRIGGRISDEYLKSKAAIQRFVDAGLRVMVNTPNPGIGTYEKDAAGKLVLNWHDRLPAWCGPLGSDQFLRSYEEMCAWLAQDLKGMVPLWQVANELDIQQFAGPLNPRQACDLIAAGARGLKSADPSVLVGHNPAGGANAGYFFGYLYGRRDGLLDYCGIDGYYGTWAPGSPDSWSRRIEEIHHLTGLPVLVNEWGFSSAGGVMDEEEAQRNAPVCAVKKWRHTWGAGHTPEGQAQFVRATFEAFRTQRQHLLGVFFYRWEDQERCWQCGAPDCPAETAWGLVDLQGRPKPAFYAFREGAARLAE